MALKGGSSRLPLAPCLSIFNRVLGSARPRRADFHQVSRAHALTRSRFSGTEKDNHTKKGISCSGIQTHDLPSQLGHWCSPAEPSRRTCSVGNKNNNKIVKKKTDLWYCIPAKGHCTLLILRLPRDCRGRFPKGGRQAICCWS